MNIKTLTPYVSEIFFIFEVKSILMIFYFSGTGNSRWVAGELAEVQNEKLFFIPDEIESLRYKNKYAVSPGEKIGFVFPVYSWGIPPFITSFIKAINFDYDCPPYIFLVCTCGDDTGLTDIIFRRLLDRKNMFCNAGFSVTMPNNYILLPGFDTDSKALETRKLEKASERIKYVNKEISLKTNNLYDFHRGKFAFLKSRIINPLFRKLQVQSRHFHANDNCIRCGLCSKVCPSHNIVLSPTPRWGNNCLQCLACIHDCPVQAIQYKNITVEKGRYHFENITE